MPAKSNFQTIMLVFFGVALLVAVLIFSGAIKTGSKSSSATSGASGEVVMWGTLKKDAMFKLIDQFNHDNETFTVSYVEKNPATFNSDLVEALASGIGPDIILLQSDSILRHSDKLYVVPFATYPEKTFKDSFITEANLYVGSIGVVGFPLFVDPMVMYYNRTMLESAGLPTPPTTWDDLVSDIPLLVKKDDTVLTRNAVALGEYDNVAHAKDILSLLILQQGNPIVTPRQNGLGAVLNLSSSQDQASPSDAVDFYTSFANPTNTNIYSWNRSFPNSRDQFVAGKLAFYFGYASELFSIQSQNPNLDFDIAQVPQLKDAQQFMTYGKVTATAILKSSKNPTTALVAANLMSAPTFTTNLINILSENKISVVPARRALLTTTPDSYYAGVFYKAGLNARGWLDPKTEVTDTIFKDMITSVNSGAASSHEAILKANTLIDQLLKGISF